MRGQSAESIDGIHQRRQARFHLRPVNEHADVGMPTVTEERIVLIENGTVGVGFDAGQGRPGPMAQPMTWRVVEQQLDEFIRGWKLNRTVLFLLVCALKGTTAKADGAQLRSLRRLLALAGLAVETFDHRLHREKHFYVRRVMPTERQRHGADKGYRQRPNGGRSAE